MDPYKPIKKDWDSISTELTQLDIRIRIISELFNIEQSDLYRAAAHDSLQESLRDLAEKCWYCGGIMIYDDAEGYPVYCIDCGKKADSE